MMFHSIVESAWFRFLGVGERKAKSCWKKFWFHVELNPGLDVLSA